jgi:hypothetical protein
VPGRDPDAHPAGDRDQRKARRAAVTNSGDASVAISAECHWPVRRG